MENSIVVVACLLALAAVALGEVAQTRLCEETNPDKCTVGAVSIHPCKFNKRTPSICPLEKRKNATITFEFTPNFISSNLKAAVYYQGMPFSELESDGACKLTTCPTVPGEKQVLIYNLYVGQRLPQGTYPIKWKVWNGDNDAEFCCFETTIKLPKK